MSSGVRVKVVSHHPLPPVKVWFELSSLSSASATISDLKAKLCDEIPSFVALSVTADHIGLEIDDFELLDASTVRVIAAGDVISIKEIAKVEQTAPYRKRKRTKDDQDRSPPKRPKTADTIEMSLSAVQRPVLSQTPGSDATSESSEPSSDEDEDDEDTEAVDQGEESSEEESTDSDEESESSSDTEDSSSESGSVTDSDSKDVPRINGGPATSTKPPQQPAKTNGSVTLATVPPGEGKASTHARNARRRKRLSLLRLAGGSTPALQSRGPDTGTDMRVASDIPLYGENVLLPYDTPPPEARVLDGKTSAVPLSSALTNKNKRKGFKKSMEGVTPQKTTFSSPIRRPRLVPPSKRDNILSNMFITSVDCEARPYMTEVEAVVTEGSFAAMEDERPPGDELDWATFEREWEKFSPLEDVNSLKEGHTILWKAIALDEATSSPSVIVQGGRVTRVDLTGPSCAVRVIPRTGYYMMDDESERAEIAHDDGSYEISIDTRGLAGRGCRLMI